VLHGLVDRLARADESGWRCDATRRGRDGRDGRSRKLCRCSLRPLAVDPSAGALEVLASPTRTPKAGCERRARCARSTEAPRARCCAAALDGAQATRLPFDNTRDIFRADSSGREHLPVHENAGGSVLHDGSGGSGASSPTRVPVTRSGRYSGVQVLSMTCQHVGGDGHLGRCRPSFASAARRR
jgi:hypothetical protein